MYWIFLLKATAIALTLTISVTNYNDEDYKQLLDDDFVISGIIKVKVIVIS